MRGGGLRPAVVFDMDQLYYFAFFVLGMVAVRNLFFGR